ncbi:hypothetical protein NEOLI_000345 [Neolecta irregularis DAH-3]|uniref:Uncharacterized protein n=1 Tax=Neolecta irregularis (strain DAH-3) TaxID=1198029 RepID=A0A1U7LVP6_NEOID|nr:hypothetical protein NEOLI_000345 [Neolecta irregularis DAH-3]|eukprot:OLL26714.1 hypothetical protein NEOLI_000345 [Neolecta irregularis DAH-3]
MTQSLPASTANMAPFIRNPFKKLPLSQSSFPPSSQSTTQETSVSSHHATVTPIVIIKECSKFNIITSPSRKDDDVYKLSVINDSGVYLPPSPQERSSSFWSHRSRSTGKTDSLFEEPFSSISRESFDSYRRSFDLGGCTREHLAPRMSLDGNCGSSGKSTKVTPFIPFVEEPGDEDLIDGMVVMDHDAKPIKKSNYLSRFGVRSRIRKSGFTIDGGEMQAISALS